MSVKKKKKKFILKNEVAHVANFRIFNYTQSQYLMFSSAKVKHRLLIGI